MSNESFIAGPCQIVGVQAEMYGETTAGNAERGRHLDTAGARWRKRVGSLRSKLRTRLLTRLFLILQYKSFTSHLLVALLICTRQIVNVLILNYLACM